MKFLLLLLLCGSAHAQVFGVHIGSHHFPNHRMNNFNPGVYARNADGYVLGIYHNSHERTSAYVGYQTSEWNRLSVSYAVATGYKEILRPAVMVNARVYSFDQGPTFKLSYIPGRTLTGGGRDVLHLTAEWGF